MTKAGLTFSAYASARVLPQDPPKTIHFSISKCLLSLSMSSTSSHVLSQEKGGHEGMGWREVHVCGVRMRQE